MLPTIPHTLDEKGSDLMGKLTKPAIWDCISGFCGVETGVPLILTEVNKGRLTLSQYVKVMREPGQGLADLSEEGCDPPGIRRRYYDHRYGQGRRHRRQQVAQQEQTFPWHGWKVKGMPVCTIVRGHVQMRDGEPTANYRPDGEATAVASSWIHEASRTTRNLSTDVAPGSESPVEGQRCGRPLLAGGTDLVIAIKEKGIPKYVVDLKKIPGLSEIRENADGSITIGALTTMRAIETDPVLNTKYPFLCQSAAEGGLDSNQKPRDRRWQYGQRHPPPTWPRV